MESIEILIELYMTKRLNLKSIQIKELEVKRKDEKINILHEKIVFMKK